jgi:hypothetical protein
MCEEADSGRMVMIASIEKRDEDAGIEKDGTGSHGRPRPYTTASTLVLALGSPEATVPAWRIHGRFAAWRSARAVATARLKNSAREIPSRAASAFASA